MIRAMSEPSPEPGALPARTPYRNALVVANPIAGRGKGEHAATELAEALRNAGIATELFLTKARDDARVRVRCADPDTDLIVAVGGDGTIGEVMAGLMSDDISVGIMPMGTSNLLGLDLSLPRDVDSVLEVLLAGHTQRIDLSEVNGHVSFLCTGVGIDAATVRALEKRRTGPISKLSYARPLLDCLWNFSKPKLSVEVDGKPIEGTFGLVVACNTIHYASYLKLARDRKLDDGLYEVYLFPSASGLSLLTYAIRGLLGRLPGGGCTMVRATSLRITSDEPVPYQVDGDYRGETPVEFRVTGRQVKLLVPNRES